MERPGRSPAAHYDHAGNQEFHTVEGAREALRTLFAQGMPASVLDVGCGSGTWLRACKELGATCVLGLDAADLPAAEMSVDKDLVVRTDLNRPFDLGRRFELLLCLETVEHLDPASSPTIIDSLCAHGDQILFSAAVPGQPGTHHINCRWPDYWQGLFNERGFACEDWPRWAIWDNPRIEPWYRQNLIWATRDEARAGKEPRLKSVIHPDMLTFWASAFLAENMRLLEEGPVSWSWYLALPFKAAGAKLRRRLTGRREA